MLTQGSKSVQSLLAWPTEQGLKKLREITAVALDAWRDSWDFRADSYSMKIHGAVVKAFFEWATKSGHLDKNPLDKLDPITVVEVPTLPVTPEEFTLLLASVACLKAINPPKN
jgi:site-specific recombinase XerD